MRDLYFWSLLAAFYLIMVNLGYPVLAQGPPGIQRPNPSNVASEPSEQFRPPQVPASRPSGADPVTLPPSASSPNTNGSSTNNTSSLFPAGFNWDQFGINDPLIRQNLVDLYGTVLGQPDCIKKSMCVLGNTFHDLPGRDAIFTFLGRYVPSTWGVLYDIFRVSIMYGQDCKIYVCDMTELPEPSLQNFVTQFSGASSTWMNLFGLGPNSSAAGVAPAGGAATSKPTPRPVVADNELHKDPNPDENSQRI